MSCIRYNRCVFKISDKGTTFTLKAFIDDCEEEGIQYVKITTEVPRSNGQVYTLIGKINDTQTQRVV